MFARKGTMIRKTRKSIRKIPVGRTQSSQSTGSKSLHSQSDEPDPDGLQHAPHPVKASPFRNDEVNQIISHVELNTPSTIVVSLSHNVNLT